MSKNEESKEMFGSVLLGWGNALLVYEGTAQELVGRLLTLTESWGLGESQEKAVKSIIKQEIYRSLDDAWIIGEKDHAMLRKKAYDFGQLSCGGLRPQEIGRGITPQQIMPE
jgi:hypothetical protein